MRPRLTLAAALLLSACAASAPTALETRVIDEAAGAEAERYLDRLATAGPDAGAEVRQLVAQAWPVLPESMRTELGTPDALRPGAGDALVAWWNGQDPLPLTAANERLVAHLARVAEAEARFPLAADAAGFDARGSAWVRYGPPAQARRLVSRSLRASGSALAVGAPDNALWTWGPGGPAVLFVEDGRAWREAGPVDLLPIGLQVPKTGPRAVAWAALTALALDDFVDALVLADPNYSRTANALDNVLFDFTGDALAAGATPVRFAGRFTLADRFGGDGGAGIIGPGFLDVVRSEHRRAAAARDRATPSLGTALPLPDALPLAVRAARFRSASGGLRIEAAWAPEPGAFDGLGGLARVLHSAAAVEAVGDPRDRRVERATTLAPGGVARGGTTPAEAATLSTVGRLPVVAVQADVLSADGALLRHAVGRVGPLAPLAAGPGGLVVSDPLVHLVPAEAVRALGTAEAARARERWRYPYGVVAPGATVGVYVEAYDLTVRGDRSRYEVERSVHVVRGGRRELVSASATESGAPAATAREFIVLPVPEDVGPGDRVELRGTLRDLVTGQTGTWSVAFGVVG